jgi:HEAT repeat protein
VTQGPAASVGVLTVDRDLTVVSWDAWLAAASRVAAASAIGSPLTELVPDLEQRRLVEPIRRVIADGMVQVLAPAFHHYLIPCRLRQPSDHFHLMQQHVTITPWRRGEQIVGAVISIEDVTARLERERELASDLRSADEAIRARAANALAATASPAALLEAFGDASWSVRRAAVDAVGRRQPGERVMAALTEALSEQHRDFSVLNATLSALALAGDDVLPELLRLSESPDADVRIYVALVLGHLGSERAVPALIRALDDADANVRFHAIEALGRLQAQTAAEPLAALAAGGDFYLAFPALDALAAIGVGTAAPRIVPLLDEPLLAAAAAQTLGRIGDEDVLAPLAARLADPAVPVGAVAGALVALHARFDEAYGEGPLVAQLARNAIDAAGARRLAAELAAADDDVLQDLVIVLGWLDFEGVTDALAGLLAHGGVREHAVDALVRRGPAAVPALLAELESGPDDARTAAAAALGRIGSAQAVPALIGALSAERELAVVSAAALAGIGDRAAFEPLVALLGSPQPGVRHAAVAALNSIGHPDMPRTVRALLDDGNDHVRESAARIAGYFGYAECFDAMLALCGDEHEPVRRAAVENIAFFAEPRAGAAVQDALASSAAPVRVAAARAAAHLPPAQGVPVLLHGLADADAWVRYHAAHSAGTLAAADLLPALAARAGADDAPHVRIAAVAALAQYAGSPDGPAAARAVSPLVAHTDPEIAAAAVHALARLGGRDADEVLRAELRSGDTTRCRAALAALGEVERAAAMVAELEELARRSTDRRLALDAVELLGVAGTEPAVTALLRLAEEPRLRAACTAALAAVHEDLIDTVGRGLHTGTGEVGCAVVEALARRKHARASRLIAAALEHGSAAVRLAAAHALRRMDIRAGERELTAAARHDADANVRRVAQMALARS